MKNSPILASIIATCIMCLAYMVMLYCMTSDKPHADPILKTHADLGQTSNKAYVELIFSSPPQRFKLIDPLSGKTLIELNNLTESEWSGEIEVPSNSEVLEYLVSSDWSETKSQQKNFIHIILSPDQKDDATTTLFSDESIDSSAVFQWRSH